MFLVPAAIVNADPVQSIRYLEINGRVETELGTAGTTAETPFAIASIGKTMTAVAILRLVAKNRLSIDDDASMWLPNKVVRGFADLNGITVRHLLNMTSGLPDYLDDAYVDRALENPNEFQQPLVALSYGYDQTPLFEPGEGFDYSNTNYVMLGLILEKASGLSYADAIRSEIFVPSGMENAFVFGSQPLPKEFPNGHEGGQHYRDYYESAGFGDGGVIASARELAEFYTALFIDKTLLPDALMDEFMNDPLREGYGMGIELEEGLIGHSGGDLGFASDVRLDIKETAIAIILSADADADTDWAFEILLD
ncbi:MAG: serine hydrolase [Paracoccaceae bacterium]|nr:serine hydrolase [Paracoccaceae bacterium]